MTPFVMASAVGAAWVAVISVSVTPAQAALEAKSSSSESSLITLVPAAACALPTLNHTLLGLSDVNVRMVDAADPAACCSACHAPDCMSWSWTGDLWTPHTPCHLSPFAPINSRPLLNHSGGSAPNAPPAPPAPPSPGPSPDPAGPGTYRVDLSPAGKRQTIWGVGFEIQSDSIGSGNNGMPGDGKLVCRVRVHRIKCTFVAHAHPCTSHHCAVLIRVVYVCCGCHACVVACTCMGACTSRARSVAQSALLDRNALSQVPDSDPTTTSAPHDLTPSERVRLATEMLTGFRWCRLALGLYLRGLTAGLFTHSRPITRPTTPTRSTSKIIT